MRNRLLLILVGFILAFNIKAQRPGDFRITGIAEVSHFYNGYLTSYGALVECFINKSFSVNYQYSFGNNQFGRFYSHYPGAVSWLVEYSAAYPLSNNNDDDKVVELLLILTLIIPEGISFHTYPRSWLEIAPFINPFSTDYNVLNNDKSTITSALGIRTHLKLGYNFSIAPHFGLKYIYKNSNTGVFYGLGFAWLF